jgi:phosphoglycolate phosphatase
MIKAVIIDVDDTLCLTEAACFDLENAALARMGRPPMSRAVHITTWGQPLFDAIVKRSPGIDVEQFKVAYHPVIEEFIKDGKLDVIPQENYEALDKLIALGKTIMLLTSRTHGEFKHMLAADHLLASRVTAFYYKDNMQYHKPDPRAFDQLLHEHNLQPEQCIYIGDSPSDGEAAGGAGLCFIASLESGIRQKQDFDGLRVDTFVDRFSDIVEAIDKLDK